ncbi:MAG: hypothetical protein AB1698_01690 [Pseudomonadota bacterium]
MSSIAQHQAAEADYEARSQQWRQNVVNSWASAREEQSQLLQRELQEQEALAQKQHLSLVEEAEAKASVENSAASAGVAGLSVANLVADVGRKAATNRMTNKRNWEMTAEQLAQEKEATVTRAENRINSVSRPTSPSGMGLAAGIGSALVGGARSFNSSFSMT